MEKNLYDSPEQYAESTKIPLELAEKWCNHFKVTHEKIDKLRYCPKCGKKTLVFESGEWEAGINDYIFCENDEILSVDEDGEECYIECDFVTGLDGEYHWLHPWSDFDTILFTSSDRSSFELEDEKEWINFVIKAIEEAKEDI